MEQRITKNGVEENKGLITTQGVNKQLMFGKEPYLNPSSKQNEIRAPLQTYEINPINLGSTAANIPMNLGFPDKVYQAGFP